MTVELIAITKGAGILEGRTAEEVIVHAARVSNPNNQNNFDTAPKLLKYCIDEKHWSIFDQADMTIKVSTSRGIAAQVMRHSFKIQEFSQRYSKASSYIPYEARRQDKKNRQNSIDDLSDEVKNWFKEQQQAIWDHAYDIYTKALEKGIAKESSRFLLPLNTETTMYLKNTCRGWIHYLQVRTLPSTQKEHRDIAEACKAIFIQQFPNISKALEWC